MSALQDSFSLEYLLLSSEPQRGSLPLHSLGRWQTSLSFALLYYKETLPASFFCSEVQWAQWIATRTSENALHSNAHICATWKQCKGIKPAKAKNKNVVFKGLKVLLYVLLIALQWKATGSFQMSAENLTLQVLSAPVVVLSTSPFALELWPSMHVLYTYGTNLIIYIFTTARWKKKRNCQNLYC